MKSVPKLTLDDIKNIFTNEDGEAFADGPKHGIEVAVSESGSMTRALFYDWCLHFVKHLKPDQGKGGKPVFLVLDGHTSRWSYEGLMYLKQNNVYVICLPSHSSIFSQPNDAGVNSSAKATQGGAERQWRINHVVEIYGVMRRYDYNAILVQGWGKFLAKMDSELKAKGENVVTRSWDNVGLKSGNRDCIFWTESIAANEHLRREGEWRTLSYLLNVTRERLLPQAQTRMVVSLRAK